MSEENKIIDLRPETDAKPEKKKRPSKWKIILLVLLTLAVLGVLTVIFLDEVLNLDKVRRFFNYLTVSDRSTYGSYTFDSGNNNAYAAFDGGLAVATQSGLSTYAASGAEVGVSQAALTTPAVLAAESYAVAYDVGGNTYTMLDQSGQTLATGKTDGTLFDMELTQSGYLCYAMSDSTYKTILVACNANRKEYYRWNSNTQYLNCCAVSDDGTFLAAIGLGQTDAQYNSTAILLRTDGTEICAQLPLGNQIIYEVKYLDNGNFCAIGEDSLIVFDTDGNKVGSYDYGGSVLTDFSTDGGFIALALNKYISGSESSVVAVDGEGNVLGEKEIGKTILSLSVCGKYVAILTQDMLTVCHQTLAQYASEDELSAAGCVIMRDDGTAILIGGGKGTLFIPD